MNFTARLPVDAVCPEPGLRAARVIDAPAPWDISGRGYVALMRAPSTTLDGDGFIAPELRGHRRPGRLAILMVVDYASTPAGPYSELLYIPGHYDFRGRHFWSISRIFVSTDHSVVNGRRNWGIPKERADFDFQPTAKGERVTVGLGGREIASLEFARAAFTLPVTTAIVPAAFRRLGQVLGGHLFQLSPGAGGRAGLSSLRAWRSDSALMPDLAVMKPLLTLDIARFKMDFPVATITPL